ncbi:CLIP-associating protein, partial [Pseudolycoriella hygida]
MKPYNKKCMFDATICYFLSVMNPKFAMAYHKPQSIDDFVSLMAKADMRVKAQLAEDLVVYLSDMENSIVSNDLGLLVDNLMPWLIGSHFK